MDLAQAGHFNEDAAQAREAATRALTSAYQAVFGGQPSPDDQALVWRDLEAFCGVRAAVMRETFHDTAHAAGMLRVFQRIYAFRFPREPRPSDAAPTPGETDGKRPEPGPGVAERTED